MEHVTCNYCDNKIELIPDGKLRFCECKKLGIDHTKYYTRYIGSVPKEHLKEEIKEEIKEDPNKENSLEK